jgi:glycerol-3-phosphate dehydrogenase
MKVGARKLRGKATTKKATKKVTKKSTAIAKVKAFKHKRVVLEPIGTESLPDMVFVSAGPSWAKDIVGKRYANTTYAINAIEALDSEKVIAKGAKSILKEMDAAGIVPLNVETI